MFTDKIACVILPVFSSILLSVKNERKYDETWQRHGRRYNDLQSEINCFVQDIGKYKDYDKDKDKDKEELFKSEISSILDRNYRTFEKNMDNKKRVKKQ